jgi:hypothetical protein
MIRPLTGHQQVVIKWRGLGGCTIYNVTSVRWAFLKRSWSTRVNITALPCRDCKKPQELCLDWRWNNCDGHHAYPVHKLQRYHCTNPLQFICSRIPKRSRICIQNVPLRNGQISGAGSLGHLEQKSLIKCSSFRHCYQASQHTCLTCWSCCL